MNRYIGDTIKGKINKNDLVEFVDEHNVIIDFIEVIKQNGQKIRLIGKKKDLLKDLQIKSKQFIIQ